MKYILFLQSLTLMKEFSKSMLTAFLLNTTSLNFQSIWLTLITIGQAIKHI